jgi:uncharacterized protein
MRGLEIKLGRAGGGERVVLLAGRAVLWPARETLLIADVHVGKPAAFASAGLPVPRGTTEADVARLEACVRAGEAWGAAVKRVVILGDLLHARSGCVEEALEAVGAWRARRSELDVVLVRGNHDRQAGDPPAEWGMRCVEEGEVDGPFVLAHEPREDERGYVLCGHVHPGLTLVGAGGVRERCAAMVVGERCAVLPAFGSFTGMGRGTVEGLAGEEGARVFVFGRGSEGVGETGGVVEVPVVVADRTSRGGRSGWRGGRGGWGGRGRE